MDFQIEKKKEIIKIIQQKANENQLTQEFLLDMQQEINRCNHIMNHILRSQYNKEGRLACGGFLGLVGFLIAADRTSSLTKTSLRAKGIMFGSALAGFIIGNYIIGPRRFGNLPDYRKNFAIYEESLTLDREINPIVRNFRV
jgi:hypothetical protein